MQLGVLSDKISPEYSRDKTPRNIQVRVQINGVSLNIKIRFEKGVTIMLKLGFVPIPRPQYLFIGKIREGDAVGDDAIACKIYQGSSVVKFDWDNSITVEAGVRAIAARFPQLDVRIEGETMNNTTTRQYQHQSSTNNGNKANYSFNQQQTERAELERILGQKGIDGIFETLE